MLIGIKNRRMKVANLKYGNDKKQENRSANNAPFFKPAIQPKLTVNEPNDIYEQEADEMADKVMRMADLSTNQDLSFSPVNNNLQRKCHACEEEEEKHIHRKENGIAGGHESHGLDSYVGALGASGERMTVGSRSFFEPRFGHDFSDVKIHTGSAAAQSAQSINALAYTTGNNIVFNEGQYAPETTSGQNYWHTS